MLPDVPQTLLVRHSRQWCRGRSAVSMTMLGALTLRHARVPLQYLGQPNRIHDREPFASVMRPCRLTRGRGAQA
jgi:hypothetical protein